MTVKRYTEMLLPCPFCAGPPVLISKWFSDGHWVNFPESLPFDDEDGCFIESWVFCHECGVDGPRAEGFCCEQSDVDSVDQKAVENWNRRDERHKELYDANRVEGRCQYPDDSVPQRETNGK